jgi:hypothetical protein
VSKIVPIYKNSGNVNDFSNFRPISIQSTFAKIFEKVMQLKLVSYLDKYNLFSASQHGFRKRKSTLTAVYEAIDTILNSLDDKKEIFGLFFDLTKAFDRVDHTVLITKLEQIGVRGIPLDWFKSYISKRSQVVTININGVKYYSDECTSSQGVPQGSILGPLLFLIYVNDFPDSLTCIPNIKPINYADDTSILLSASTYTSLVHNSRAAVDLFNQWCGNCKLKLNMQKTKVIHFSHKKICESPLIKANGAAIEKVPSMKFLGIHLTENVTWDVHIEHLRNKLSSICYLLRQLKHSTSNAVLLSVYYSDFYSRIIYSILFWGSSQLSQIIFRSQKRAIRIIAGKPYNSPSKPIFEDLKLLPLPCIYIYIAVIHVKNNFNDFLLNRDIHDHNTRMAANIHLRNIRTTSLQTGPKEMGIKLFNKLPTHLKKIENLNSFKYQVKKHLLLKMYYTVNDYLDCKNK